MVSEGAQQHADVVNGLLYAILTESHKTGPPPSASSHTVPAAAVRLFGILCSVTRDHHASLLATLQRLASDTWGKLQDHVRSQVIWILRQLVQQAVQEAETLFLCLFRQVSGGDLSVGNVWLARQLLDVLRTNTQWLYTLPNLLALSLYTFLRLLPDHAVSKAPTVVELKQQEVAFCTQLIRERFQDCLVIGRDLVRLLQDVALIPDFEPIWRDLVHRPETMGAPGFSDLAQLYVVRTPTRFITSRVTPEMESQLRFLLAHVRMGHQRRYQTWFATRFLAAPESESLVADLIRFVCCSVHPTNQVLQSDVVPRWAIVGWLLKCCRSCHMEANAKLALFYDWLFFMPKTDNIMNIEPAMLCMVHSLPKYAIMTNSLLEFLFLLLDHYDAAHRDLILRGISASIDILVGKGVVPSLEPLATSGFIPTKLRERLQTLFPAHCRLDAPSPPHLAAERDSMGNIVGGGAGKRAVEEQRGKEGQVADMGEVGAGVSGSRPVGGSSAAAAAAAARREPIDASGSIAGAGAGEDAEKGEASAAGEDQAGGKGPGGAEKRGESAEGAEMELGEHGGGEGEVAEGGSGKGDRKRKREEREEGEEEAEEGGDVEAGEVEGGDVVEEEGKGEQSEELEGMDEEMKAVEGIVKSMEEAAAAGDGAKVIEGFKAFLEALRGEYSGIESGGRKPQREAEGKAPGNGHGEFKGGQETENEGRGGMGGVGGTGKRAREGRHAVKGEQRDEEDAGLDEERSDRSVDSDEAATGKDASGSGASEDGTSGNGVSAGAAAVKAKLGTPYPFEGAALSRWTSTEKPAAECVGQQGKKEGLGNGNKGVVAEVFFGLYERLVGLCWGRDEEGSNEEEDVREEGRGEGRDGGRGEGSGMEKDGGGDGGTGRKGGLMGKEKKGGIGAGKQASSAGAAGLSGGPGAAEGKGAALEEKAEEGAGEDKLPPPRCNGVLASEVSAGGRNKHQRRQQVFVSLVGDSWSWDGQEQQWLWQLAAAEAVGWGNTSEGLVGVESEEYVDNEQRQKKQQQGGEELSIALLLLQASATAAASSNSSADTSNIPTSKSAAPPASHNAWEGPSCEALAEETAIRPFSSDDGAFWQLHGREFSILRRRLTKSTAAQATPSPSPVPPKKKKKPTPSPVKDSSGNNKNSGGGGGSSKNSSKPQTKSGGGSSGGSNGTSQPKSQPNSKSPPEVQGGSTKKSPNKSPTKSPVKSPNQSPTKSPNKSPNKSPDKSPNKSPKKSPDKSPNKSPNKSPSKPKSPPKPAETNVTKSPKSPKKPKSPKSPKPPKPPTPPPAPPKIECEAHKNEQLVIMDGNLFFTNKLDQCEGSCIGDANCLYYTFSGLSCQLFTANMTIKPTKRCFSRKCQWAKCRDAEDGDYE
ncbi:unnamed protein product [Closterium sp. Yama58-4]|nr:unnamed protein product [Closterium sp. Yama58-4]